MFDLNTKSTFFLIKEAYPLLLKAGEGANILIISSTSGQYPPQVMGVYGMTKAAVDNMVKWMSKEFRPDGIRCNSLAPGVIATELSGPLWKGDGIGLPKESIGQAEHIGSVAATICSKDGSFMNGSIYHANGGFYSHENL